MLGKERFLQFVCSFVWGVEMESLVFLRNLKSII